MNRVYSIIYCLVWPFFSLFHPCRMIGRERLPETGALYCANHSTMSDPFCLIAASGIKRQYRIMAKAEIMRWPIVGWILKKAGIFGVERGKSDVTAIKTAMRFLKSGENVMLFPEGTRIRDGVDKHGNESQAKLGAAMLAVRTGVQLVPVYIPPRKRWFRFTYLVAGEPYYPEVGSKKGNSEEYQAIGDDLMRRIYALKEQSR